MNSRRPRDLTNAPPEPLPFPALQATTVRLVEELLLRALAAVQARHAVLRNEHETSINQAVVAEIERLRRDEVLLDAVFSTCCSGEELDSYDKGSIQQKCDISLRLRATPQGLRDSRYWSVFVECKRIDADSCCTTSLYNSEGVHRFVTGKYAWKMRDGFMLAYVFDNTTLATGLDSARVVATGTSGTVGAEIGVTKHSRSWTYQDGSQPGQVRLSHVWVALK